MQNKNVLIGILILIVGLVIGAAITTRHYGVGPLVGLNGVKSNASVGDTSLSKQNQLLLNQYNSACGADLTNISKECSVFLQSLETQTKQVGTGSGNLIGGSSMSCSEWREQLAIATAQHNNGWMLWLLEHIPSGCRGIMTWN